MRAGVQLGMRASHGLAFSALLFVLTASATAQEAYFPKNALGRDVRSDQRKAMWYSHELKVLGEPSFFKLANNPSSESYRFLWLRTFHPPIAIRLDLQADGSGILTTKTANGEAGFPYTVKQLAKSGSRTIERERIQALLGRLTRAGFWSLPPETYDQTGTDGSQWIIEGIKQGTYHFVDRWSPDEGSVRELGLMFIFDLAQMKIPEDQVY